VSVQGVEGVICSPKPSMRRNTVTLRRGAIRTRAANISVPPLPSAKGLTQPIMNSSEAILAGKSDFYYLITILPVSTVIVIVIFIFFITQADSKKPDNW